MLGTVTVEIQLAPASISMQGCDIVAGAVTQALNNVTKGEVGRTQIAAGGIAACAGALAAENADYALVYPLFKLSLNQL